MSQKPSRPLFQQALSAVKKSFTNTNNKPNQQDKSKQLINNDPFDQMSSGEKQRLKQMGVDIKKTKTIKKQTHKQSSNNQLSWKHDKFHNNTSKQTKTNKSSSIITPYKKHHNSWTITFPQPQDYSKIYQIVKSQKAFIQEINSSHIKFSLQSAYNTCRNLLKKQNVLFEEPKTKETIPIADKSQKKSIFERLK